MADLRQLDAETEALLADSSSDELWLVSYADLLTLLLGFFVLIIASSVAKPAKFEQLAASMDTGAAPLQTLKSQVDALVEHGQLTGAVLTREDGDGLGIEFKDALLFDSGSAQVRPGGRAVIAQVAALLRAFPGRTLTIEGHTDDQPIRNSVFASNWELSTQRAINVLSELEASGVPHDRASVRGYAETRPIQLSGPVEQRRLANRRVVVRVE